MERDDALLLDTLRDLRKAVTKVQDGQDDLKDRITEMDTGLHTKLATTTTALDARVTAMEKDQVSYKAELKRTARKWGAAGGAGAVITAGITTLIATFSRTTK
ncbi:hypothetical protein [uncultured Paludibaculum sp.]|uniref:hypothetical protein n=1 Tax=uncultured Paludibaculum sp. TaxID=1765020 RepID=UPI002AAB947B|nr:hypothetical protein [uncultured Paludibaculum sp.]